MLSPEHSEAYCLFVMASGRVSFLDQQQNREVTELGLRLKEASENVTINHTGIQQTAKRPIIKKVLETMAAGIDVSPLFGDVIKVRVVSVLRYYQSIHTLR